MKKNEENRTEIINFRITKSQKSEWKKKSSQRKISLTDFIISSVENKMTQQEENQILKFIEKQDNVFAKIQNNINQFAKIANTKKQVNQFQMSAFIEALAKIENLKSKQNEIFKSIYKLMSQ